MITRARLQIRARPRHLEIRRREIRHPEIQALRSRFLPLVILPRGGLAARAAWIRLARAAVLEVLSAAEFTSGVASHMRAASLEAIDLSIKQ